MNATSHPAVADIFAAGSWGYAAAQSAVAAVGSLEIAQARMIQNVALWNLIPQVSVVHLRHDARPVEMAQALMLRHDMCYQLFWSALLQHLLRPENARPDEVARVFQERLRHGIANLTVMLCYNSEQSMHYGSGIHKCILRRNNAKPAAVVLRCLRTSSLLRNMLPTPAVVLRCPHTSSLLWNALLTP